jgi:hypothetical protein
METVEGRAAEDHMVCTFEWDHLKGYGCRCSGYWGIPVHLLLGLFNGPASAQGATTTEAKGEDPRVEVPHMENDD